MKLWPGRPQADPDDTVQDPTPAPAMASSWTMGARLAAGATTALLWVAIACGPAAVGLIAWQLNQPAAAPVESTGLDPEQQAEQVRAEEFAVRAVTTWLEARRGQEDLLKALLPQASALSLPATGMTVDDPMVAASEQVTGSTGVWSITVAATVADFRMQARRFFAIPVQVVGDTAVAVSLPREVAGTLLAATSPAVDYRVAVAASSSLYTTAEEFLGALLAGQGDVARFIAPAAEIRAVSPAPFTAVDVTQLAAHSSVPEAPTEGASLDVLVTAIAESGDQRVVVQYPLTLEVRAGRWEVAAIRDMPLVSTKSATASPAASQAPAATVSPTPTASTTPTQSAQPTNQ